MQDLIEALLAYTRVGTSEGNHTEIAVEGILADVTANLAASIGHSGARVVFDGLPTVLGDKVLLGQLFQNLIGNAIKFRGEAPPEVQVNAVAEPDSEETLWRFCVRDNGIGIDPDFSGRIFKVFQRLHTRQEYPGTGIGLAICKRIVERHGGRLWLESSPGNGAAFYFTLRAARAQQKESV